MGDFEQQWESLTRDCPDALALAELLSFATLAEPALIRRMRLKFLPNTDAGTEADLWFLPIVTHYGLDGIVFEPEAAESLRGRLARRDPARYEAAWAEIEQTHLFLSPALRLEEKVAYLQHSLRSGSKEEMATLFRAAIVALRDPNRPGLVHWAARALPRFPEEVRKTPEARMLATGVAFRLSDSIVTSDLLPMGQHVDSLAWLAPDDLQSVPVVVKLYPGSVEVAAVPPREGDDVIKVPKTDPLVLEVGGAEFERVHSKGKVLTIYVVYQQEESGIANKLIRYWNESSDIPVPVQAFSNEDHLPGETWSGQIEEKMAQSDVVLVLIGEQWKPRSWFGKDIHAAIQRDIPVAPVLFERASMPSRDDEFTDKFAFLYDLLPFTVRNNSFDSDVRKMTLDLQHRVAPTRGSYVLPISYRTLRFQEGETRRFEVDGDVTLLRTVTGGEYEFITVDRAVEAALADFDPDGQLEAFTRLGSKVTRKVLKDALKKIPLDPALAGKLGEISGKLKGKTSDYLCAEAVAMALRLLDLKHDLRALKQLRRSLPMKQQKHLEKRVLAIRDDLLRKRAMRELDYSTGPKRFEHLADEVISESYLGEDEAFIPPPKGNLRRRSTMKIHEGRINALASFPDHQNIVSASDDKTLKLWDWMNLDRMITFVGHSEAVTCVTTTANHWRIVSGGRDHTVRLWDSDIGKEIAVLERAFGAIQALALADFRDLVVFGSQEMLQTWDLQSQSPRSTFPITGSVRCLSAGKNRYIYLGCDDGTLKIWDLEKESELASLRGHKNPVTSVSVAPDGRLAVSGDSGGVLIIWELQSAANAYPMKTIRAHSDTINAVAMAEEGGVFVSGSEDGWAKVWHFSGEEIAELYLDNPVTACVVHPDGSEIFCGHPDGSVDLLTLSTPAKKRNRPSKPPLLRKK